MREQFEAAVGDVVFAATDGDGLVDDSVVALSRACVAFVACVREERRLLLDEETRERLGESLLVVSKATKGLALAGAPRLSRRSMASDI